MVFLGTSWGFSVSLHVLGLWTQGVGFDEICIGVQCLLGGGSWAETRIR